MGLAIVVVGTGGIDGSTVQGGKVSRQSVENRQRRANKNEVSGRPNNIWAGLKPLGPGMLRHSRRPRWNESTSRLTLFIVFSASVFRAFTAASAWPFDCG